MFLLNNLLFIYIVNKIQIKNKLDFFCVPYLLFVKLYDAK
jgi:hypothetical protein